jgi:hypothetical protein
MTKKYLIEVLERNVKMLKNRNIPDEFKLFHHIDTGGYSDDCNEIYHFDLNLSHEVEDGVMVVEYFGDENPGT